MIWGLTDEQMYELLQKSCDDQMETLRKAKEIDEQAPEEESN